MQARQCVSRGQRARVLEIIAAIVILAAVVLYAVRDTQRRSYDAELQEYSEVEDTREVPAHGSEVQADQPLSESADRA
ncbi:MAG: hypothetical protein ACRDRI_17135 [Pseudonocardiaceae bacterium]